MPRTACAGAYGWWALSLLVCAEGVGAGVVVPLGPETQVNQQTAGFQSAPAVAASPDGHFAVVWETPSEPLGDGDDTDIAGRFVALDSSPIGAEFQVNTHTLGAQEHPRAAFGPSGELVVVWETAGAGGLLGEVRVRRFDPTGDALGPDSVVGGSLSGSTLLPELAVRGDSGFVVLWNGLTGWARVFGPDGAPETPAVDLESLAGDFELDFQFRGVASPDGGFVASWLRCLAVPPALVCDLRARPFDRQARALGSEFVVAPQISGYATLAITRAPTGHVGLAWDMEFVPPYEGDSARARVVSPDGVLGEPFDLGPLDSIHETTLAGADDGSFVVVWNARTPFGTPGPVDDDWGIRARRFAPDGAPLDDGFAVNGYTTSRQGVPVVVSHDGRSFVVAWQSRGSHGDDDFGDSIQVRTLATREPPFASDLRAALTGPTDPHRGGDVVTFELVVENGSADPQLDLAGDELVLALPGALDLLDVRATTGRVELDAPSRSARWSGMVLPGPAVLLEIDALVRGDAPDGTVLVQGTVAFDGDGDGTSESSRLTDDPRRPGSADATPLTIAQGLLFADGFESGSVDRWFEARMGEEP